MDTILIVRGNYYKVNIDEAMAKRMKVEGWKWSGHSHIYTDGLSTMASRGDIAILRAFG